MSESKKKTGKRLLIALVVIVLVGGCFGAVGIYAHRELTKPKFEKEDPQVTSVRELPADKSEALSYMKELYDAAIAADNVEVSWHTDAKLGGYEEEMSAPFSDADKSVIAYIMQQAGDQIRNSVYPKVDGVLQGDQNGAFKFDLTDADVLDFTAEQGRYNDREEYLDDGTYFISLTVDPAWINTDAIPSGEPFARFKELVAPAFSVQSAAFEATGARLSFNVARAFNELSHMEITRSYHVKATVVFTEAYAALAGGEAGKPVEIELPYEATEKYDFYYYGAHFEKEWIAVQPDDWQALPARVHVHADEAQENFKLTYDISDPNVMSIDEDSVMRVEKKGVTDELVTVTMTLEYKGHVYTDKLQVYITTLEVKTDE